MAVIVLRSVKGSPLTIAEADANFSNLNTEVGLKLDATNYTAADVLTKIKTVDGASSGLDADLLDGLNASNSHVTSTATVVSRDTSGNFSANTVTANLVGNVTGNITGNLTGTVTGNATNVSGVVAINNGGTGATTAAAARIALGFGSITEQDSSSVAITGGSIIGITDLAIADGGTGASSAIQARTNLGLVIGADIQPFNNQLTALSAVSTNGFLVRTATGTAAARTITGGTAVTITNADGVSGNPLISLSSNLVSLSGVSTNGFFVRTATSTAAARTITGGTAVTITNGDGVSGNPLISLSSNLVSLSSLSTNGIVVKTGAGTTAARTITGGTAVTITNADGVSGNPLISLSSNLVSLSEISPGTEGNVIKSNGTAWTSAAPTVVRGLGLNGEVWNNVTSSRAFGTTYTNSRGYPIMISATSNGSGSSGLTINVNGTEVYFNQAQWNGSGAFGGGTLIIPSGATYSITASSSLRTWWELY